MKLDTTYAPKSNPCIQCGQERIDSKTWTEEVDTFFGKSVITHTETVCPNPDCQVIVDEKLQAQRLKNETMKIERKERMENLVKARKLAREKLLKQKAQM